MSWSVAERDGGFVVLWRRQGWGMAPKPTRKEAVAYKRRLAARYPTGGEWLVDAAQNRPDPRNRGGPWRWTLPDGSSGIIHTTRLTDAKSILRRELRRKRLPNNIRWEIAEERRRT